MARNVKRPHTLELVSAMATDVVELHGDRLYRDDPAVVGGFCRFDGRRAVFVGHQKGAETDENIRRNFGMAHPEGYRKGMRLMALAERFRLPLVTIIDTPGASPGPEDEERGVAEAIAQSIALMTRLQTPIVSVIAGEGGSGGALAIAVGDVVVALENATYSVITPEGCASILWRTPGAAQKAAVAMRMTAAEQLELGVVDVVVPEPGAGAQSDHAETARRLRVEIEAQLDRLGAIPLPELVEARYRRYRTMGQFTTVTEPTPGSTERPGLTDRLRILFGSRPQVLGGGAAKGRDDVQPPARDEV
jgi:acetyl-CoA carboxylase carboxyl transferase alpha subunit